MAFDVGDAVLLGQVADYYAATLKQSPGALAYLEARGITGSAAAEAIEVFKLGYANRTLGLRLPERTRKAGADIRTWLERLGVYGESGHEHMNGSLVIPLFDAAGQAVNLYGCKVSSDLRTGTPAHRSINCTSTDVKAWSSSCSAPLLREHRLDHLDSEPTAGLVGSHHLLGDLQRLGLAEHVSGPGETNHGAPMAAMVPRGCVLRPRAGLRPAPRGARR